MTHTVNDCSCVVMHLTAVPRDIKEAVTRRQTRIPGIEDRMFSSQESGEALVRHWIWMTLSLTLIPCVWVSKMNDRILRRAEQKSIQKKFLWFLRKSSQWIPSLKKHFHNILQYHCLQVDTWVQPEKGSKLPLGCTATVTVDSGRAYAETDSTTLD